MSASDVGARLARWRRTGDPNDLWPGLDPAEFHLAMEEIGQAARFALRVATPAAPLERAFSARPRELGVAAFVSGLGPLLGYWSERGLIGSDPERGRVLAEHLAEGRARAERLDRELGRVLDALAAEAVPVALLKGQHTAWDYFPDPGTRPSSDIDLLVSAADHARAGAVLARLGFRQRGVLADGSRADWVPPDVPGEPASLEISHRDNPWSVDLHVSLDRTLRYGLSPRFGRPRPQDGPRWDRRGHACYVLPQPLLLAWLAFHALGHLEQGPMVRYLELVLVARRDFGADARLWDAFLALGRRTGSLALAFPALHLAERLAPGTIPPPVLLELKRSAPWMVRWVVGGLRPETAQQLYRLSVDVRIMWLCSLPGLAAVLRGVRRPWRQGLAGESLPFAWLRGQVRRVFLLLRGRLSLRARH